MLWKTKAQLRQENEALLDVFSELLVKHAELIAQVRASTLEPELESKEDNVPVPGHYL